MSEIATDTSLPAAGAYAVDPQHSEVSFRVRHLVSKVRGRFLDFEGTVTIGDSAEASSVTASVKTTSVDTASADRDAHLRNADFFESEAHPEMTFASTAVRPKGDAYELVGDLTIKGISKPVTFDLDFLGNVTDPWGNPRACFEATTTINREDWDLTWNQALETGGVMVGKDVTITIEVQAVKA